MHPLPLPPRLFRRLLVTAALGAGTLAAAAGASLREFSSWPQGAEPAAVGRRVAGNIAARPFEWQTKPSRKFVIYPEVCAWYGALEVARLTADGPLQEKLVRRYDPLLTPGGAARISPQHHVDYRVFGAVPLEIFLVTGDRAFLERGLAFADGQWDTTTGDGITTEARYWVDDLWMSPLLQVQAWRATHDRKYLTRSARMVAAYLAKLQQPNGLFYHAPDSPFFWGRGNGWVAAGMTELLRELPPDDPDRGPVLAGYQRMSAALLQAQDPAGMWHQLLDHPESFAESSGTGMFAYALVTGARLGWIDAATAAPAARRAWLALVQRLDAQGNVSDVCAGTNKSRQEAGPDLQKQLEFYLARPRVTGDLHGQSPLLWTAAALLRPGA